jgi:site-specific DNA-methyltransferase (adenine-specific)
MTEPYYDDDTVTLYLGDAREIVPELGLTADLIVTDPPFGETSLAWDRWPDGWLNAAAQASRSMWCFGSLGMFMDHAAEFPAAKWRRSQDVIGVDEDGTPISGDVSIVWEKHNPSGPDADRFRRIHEHVGLWYQGAWSSVRHEAQRVTTGVVERGRVVNQGAKDIGQRGTYAQNGWSDDGTRLMTSVIRVRSMHRMGNIAPTEKPVAILEPLIRYACPPNGVVLDLFLGSGSSLDAARQCGRRGIGIEMHEPQLEAAAKRLSQLTLPIGA